MAGMQDILIQDKFRELGRKYKQLERDNILPEIEVNRPGPDTQGFYNRLIKQLEVNRAATGVSSALAAAERARRAQAEAQSLENQWGSYDLSGVNAQFMDQQGLTNKPTSGNTKPYGLPLRSYSRFSGEFKGGYRSSGGHSGLDIAAPRGTPIYATHSGYVSFAGSSGKYGNMVTLSSKGGFVTKYAHQSRIAVRSGTWVNKGQVIGYVGATGNATGNHLHYEVWVNGRMTNPRGYF
jgi:murein DD-endopeptidase MepM/ murein hydrolase activator NlpD